MADKIGCIGYILYLIVGFIQLFAIVEGVKIWFDFNFLFSAIIAFFVTYIPIVGAIAGVIGAVEGWGWSYLKAGLLFGTPYIVYIFLVILAFIVQATDKKGQ